MATTETLQQVVARLSASANALAALGAAIDARSTGASLEPRLKARIDEVLAAVGANEALEGAHSDELRPLLGELRTFSLTNTKLLFTASRGAGWTHREPELLEAAGDVSTAVPHMIKRVVAPELEGLADTLAKPDAAFLDVGVGVAAMSIEMARLWPSLRVVGIDLWAPAIEMARARVRGAALEQRIELRLQAAQDLPDRDVFDLAWIPSLFVPEAVLARVIEQVRAALRPGGWLLFPVVRPGTDRLLASLARMRVAMFGGFDTTPADAEALLRAHGFTSVRTLPNPPASLAVTIAARRAA
jgi:SAM-dependent methyltransferase